MIGQRLYAFGLIETRKQNSLNLNLKGWEDDFLYYIPFLDLRMIVSPYTKVMRSQEYLLKHEQIIEELMNQTTVLPMQAFTLFKKEEEISLVMKKYYHDFKMNFQRLHQKIEFGLKVIWPGDQIRSSIKDRFTMNDQPLAGSSNNQPLAGSSQTPGQAFFINKFRDYLIEQEFQKEAEQRINFFDSHFSPWACEKKIERLPTRSLLFKACYLVDRKQEANFLENIRWMKAEKNDHLHYLFTGPWPPYNFIVLTSCAAHRQDACAT